MGVYRLEISPTGRAICKTKECKDDVIKIQKGELRYGTQYTFDDRQAWSWRHWGCVTPKQIENLKETIEDNLDYLDGYEDITEEMQAKVRQALEDGHVADEDWRGDVEVNRAGKKGFRSPAAKKAKKDAEAENGDGSLSPSKPAPKKRSRVKKEDGEEEAEPAPKKAKVSKKAKRAEAIEDDGDSGIETPVPKKAKGKGKKLNAQAVKDEGDSEHEIPPKKARAPRKATTSKKIKAETSDAEANGETIEEAPKKVRAPRKAAATKKAKAEAADGRLKEEIAEEVPDTSGVPDEAESAMEVKDEGPEDDVDHELSEEAKPQRGRKKAAGRAPNARSLRSSAT